MTDKAQFPIRNDFSRVVDAYSKYRRDYIDKVYDLIYQFCPDQKSNVLDVGCGTGLVTNHLAGYYHHVTGTDKSQEMLKVAKNSGSKNSSFYAAPAEQLPFENNIFDLVTAGAAYHWFDYEKAGKEIYRILKSDGRLCVFWKYAPGSLNGYLPEFAIKNLRSFVSDIPTTNKKPIGADIFSEVGFSKIDDDEFDFDDIYTKEGILGYIQSHSTYNLLADEQKEEYKRLNENDVDGYLIGGKFVFESRMEMWFVEK